MDKLLKEAKGLKINQFSNLIKDLIEKKQSLISSDGNQLINKFRNFYNLLPDFNSSFKDLSGNYITAGKREDISDKEYDLLHDSLINFLPWRKGPFNLFGIDIDTEWRSDLKWERFSNSIDLEDKKILDIGSSNGYYMFKMANFNPRFALGLEPFIPYYFQYMAIQKYLGLNNIFTIPCTFDELPMEESFFDYVFCMGVLYHRKSPINMLSKIRKIMDKKGVLILENLIIEGDESIALVPESRYAKMNNVHFVPTIKTLEIWLKKSGFSNIECLDISKTDLNEQRATEWTFDMSLKDFLDPSDMNKTIEGYPAPVRAVIKARAV